MLVYSRNTALKELSSRLFTQMAAKETPLAVAAQPKASFWTKRKLVNKNPYGWEQEKLRMQLEHDAHMQAEQLEWNERIRLAKVWVWTGAFVACFAFNKVEAIHANHLRHQKLKDMRPDGSLVSQTFCAF